MWNWFAAKTKEQIPNFGLTIYIWRFLKAWNLNEPKFPKKTTTAEKHIILFLHPLCTNIEGAAGALQNADNLMALIRVAHAIKLPPWEYKIIISSSNTQNEKINDLYINDFMLFISFIFMLIYKAN